MPKRVLVPFDGSEPSSDALDVAIDQYPEGELIALHVLDPAESQCGSRKTSTGLSMQAWECAEKLLTGAEQQVAESVSDPVLTTAIEVGRPKRTILTYVREQEIDCIVLGSQEYSRLYRFLVGSMAESVARRSPVPVTIV